MCFLSRFFAAFPTVFFRKAIKELGQIRVEKAVLWTFFVEFFLLVWSPSTYGESIFGLKYLCFFSQKTKHEKSRSLNIDDGFAPTGSEGKKKAMSTRCGFGLEAKLLPER